MINKCGMVAVVTLGSTGVIFLVQDMQKLEGEKHPRREIIPHGYQILVKSCD